MRELRRYLGLELAGAKNQKTALAALEYYPKEKKVFLLDIYDRISGHREENEGHGLRGNHEGHGRHGAHHSHGHRHASGPLGVNGAYGMTTSGDEALLDLIHELTEDVDPKTLKMGVNVPLTLPPSLHLTTSRACPKPSAATTASVKWMREANKKAERLARSEESCPRVLEFTTYTQRPIELWVRYNVLSKLPETHRFEIDETLGGTKAPLTARMNFLRCHLGKLPLLEVWPKLTVAILAVELELSRRVVQSYRRLEEGIHAREQILESLVEKHGIFIYERDVSKLAHSLPAFDAFVCAYTALLSDTQRCAKPPSGFPIASGWVQYPQC